MNQLKVKRWTKNIKYMQAKIEQALVISKNVIQDKS